jgi:hypothetical protein
VSNELTNATYMGGAVSIQTTDFTSEADLMKDGKEFMLVTVIGITSPNGSTFDVNVRICNYCNGRRSIFRNS